MRERYSTDVSLSCAIRNLIPFIGDETTNYKLNNNSLVILSNIASLSYTTSRERVNVKLDHSHPRRVENHKMSIELYTKIKVACNQDQLQFTMFDLVVKINDCVTSLVSIICSDVSVSYHSQL